MQWITFVLLLNVLQSTDDWYTLVTQVTQGGPADGRLMVGDWIRSIDGHALVNPNEVY